MRLTEDYFTSEESLADKARGLLGRELVLEGEEGVEARVRITGIAAYEGGKSVVMKLDGGKYSVSAPYGRYMLDISVGGACLSIRAGETSPFGDTLSLNGPSKVTKALGIDKKTKSRYQGLPVENDILYIEGEPVGEDQITEGKKNSSNCVGVWSILEIVE